MGKEPTTNVQETETESNAIKLSMASQEKLPDTKESYLQAIKEMYPGTNIHQLSSCLQYFDNWATVRAAAALKAFAAVKDMIQNGKLVYDDRASLSDDDSVASYMKPKPKKKT